MEVKPGDQINKVAKISNGDSHAFILSTGLGTIYSLELAGRKLQIPMFPIVVGGYEARNTFLMNQPGFNVRPLTESEVDEAGFEGSTYHHGHQHRLESDHGELLTDNSSGETNGVNFVINYNATAEFPWSYDCEQSLVLIQGENGIEFVRKVRIRNVSDTPMNLNIGFHDFEHNTLSDEAKGEISNILKTKKNASQFMDQIRKVIGSYGTEDYENNMIEAEEFMRTLGLFEIIDRQVHSTAVLNANEEKLFDFQTYNNPSDERENKAGQIMAVDHKDYYLVYELSGDFLNQDDVNANFNSWTDNVGIYKLDAVLKLIEQQELLYGNKFAEFNNSFYKGIFAEYENIYGVKFNNYMEYLVFNMFVERSYVCPVEIVYPTANVNRKPVPKIFLNPDEEREFEIRMRVIEKPTN